MGTITPAITLPSTLDLLSPQARANPGPGERVQSLVLQRTLESDPLGWWGNDRYEQTNHYTGLISVAIKAYMDAIAGAKINVLRRKQPARDGVLTKSVFGTGNYSRDDDYEPADPDHPLCQVIEQPGGEDGVWSMTQECTFLTLQHMLTGDAPAWAPLNEAGKPVRFFSLTSALTQPMFSAGANPAYPKGAYRVTPFGSTGFYMAGGLMSQAILPGEEVKRFREFHPWSRNYGMSRLQSGAREIDVLEAIMQSRWAMFDHGMQLDVLALIPGLDETGTKDVKAAMTERHGGAKNARRFAVLSYPPGSQDKPTVQTFGQSAREMDYTQSYDQQGGIVLAVFRVPKGVAGLTSQTSYAQHYAELQQFWDLGITPYCRALGVFLTQSMAVPWSEFPGEYVIEVEAIKPADVEMQEKEREFAVSQGLITVNEYRSATNRKPIADGDVPAQIYTAKLQQEIAPPPMPGMPGAEGDLPLLGGGQPQGGAEQAPADDTPEGTQDAVVQAALASMGLGGGPGGEPQPEAMGEPEEQQPGDVLKAVPKPTKPKARKRAEGEKWESNGRWWTIKGGHTVPMANPAGQQGQQVPTVKPRGAKPESPGTSGGGLLDVRQAIDAHGGDANKAADAIRAKMSEHMAAGGKVSLWVDGKQVPVAKVEGNRVLDAKGQPWGMLPMAMGTKGTKSGVEFHPAEQAQPGAQPQAPQQPAFDRAKAHAAILKTNGARKWGFSEQVLSKMPEAAVKTIAAQLGIIPAEPVIAPHAEQVPAQTPTQQDTLSKAREWAGQMAAKHAQRVAQHFGIPPDQAQRILVRAIVMVAEHAAKTGGKASGTVNIGGKQLKVGVNQRQPGQAPTRAPQPAPSPPSGPTGGAPPRPENPAGEGSRPPSAAPKRGLVGRALDHALRHLGTPAEKRLARQRIASRTRKALPVDGAELDAIADAEELALDDAERESLLKALQPAASTLDDGAGGFLAQAGSTRRRRKKGRDVVARVLKALEE